ncbi:MAG: pyruvate carboxylase subunit B [Kiritimatiellaeota bacterium]|nr:pyruvate carboxylase subunit B [Kiritimatiellota bacterium]
MKKSARDSAAGSEKMPAGRISLRITDTTLRDAHQSLWATRLRTADIVEIIDVIDQVGFYSLECWGGATFDVCMRYLRENPWERLRQIKAKAKKTPLQMLLRGQNVLGYRHYPDDVLERFIALAVQNGMDIFRIFDALNDNRNVEKSIQLVKKYGGHAQGTICYTISPVHTTELFVQIVREQEQMGADSICIKDMAGILTPLAAERLVTALVKNTKLPIQLHTHATLGMSISAYVEGVRAGAGAIDCAVWSMAGYSSQPPVETLLTIFDETNYRANLDRDALRKMGAYFQNLKQLREPAIGPGNYIDAEVLTHHIPGGMISNLRSQLKQQDALDRLDEVIQELPRTRADMGYPPLVTPTSQIVGVQSVLNVLSGERYAMVTQETKDYLRGAYGRPPVPIDPKFRKTIIGKEKVIDTRPADLLPPMLGTATDDVDPKLIRDEEDILSFCLFPEISLEYFVWRNMPPGQRPPVPADEEEAKKGQGAAAVQVAPAKPLMAPTDYVEIQKLLETVRQLGIEELTIRRPDATVELRSATGVTASAPMEGERPRSPSRDVEGERPREPSHDEVRGDTVNAPLTGTFYRTSGLNKPNMAEEGATLNAGEPLCIVEAMKLFNQIKVSHSCKVVQFLVKHGTLVQKGTPLAAIEYM